MPRDASIWIPRESFYAMRWGDWLAARRAPALSEWAETRAERDNRRDRASVSYRVPSKAPPATGDDEARGAVYDHIRLRLGMPTGKSEAA